ncbi:GNAT family N-acetyltransferase [Paenibacillus sp. FSL H8-0034]|uniref:GNAT family N-acetyltransferase n=1 Tax=Paenibacillus sp. FSL H8-0034 TaxID=2954671 RepID=UPI0030F87D6D
MEYQTIDYWDEQIWNQAAPIYRQGFDPENSKPTTIIRRSIERKLCQLHIASNQSDIIAMALTGKLEGINGLLIDYMAVREDSRGQGIGKMFLDYIISWSRSALQSTGAVIEIESEDNATNIQRLHFWQHYGFTLTSYVHTYIWVPEKYQALYLIWQPGSQIPQDGEILFEHISHFHNKAYAKK